MIESYEPIYGRDLEVEEFVGELRGAEIDSVVSNVISEITKKLSLQPLSKSLQNVLGEFDRAQEIQPKEGSDELSNEVQSILVNALSTLKHTDHPKIIELLQTELAMTLNEGTTIDTRTVDFVNRLDENEVSSALWRINDNYFRGSGKPMIPDILKEALIVEINHINLETMKHQLSKIIELGIYHYNYRDILKQLDEFMYGGNIGEVLTDKEHIDA